MKFILFILLFLACSGICSEETLSSPEDSTDTGLFGLILDLASTEARFWAKPIEHADMERIIDLIEAGLLTSHKADWYAQVDEENE